MLLVFRSGSGYTCAAEISECVIYVGKPQIFGLLSQSDCN